MRGLTVKNGFGVIVLNLYLACVMAWMLVLVVVAVAQLIS
jgi:hypothetical protein